MPDFHKVSCRNFTSNKNLFGSDMTKDDNGIVRSTGGEKAVQAAPKDDSSKENNRNHLSEHISGIEESGLLLDYTERLKESYSAANFTNDRNANVDSSCSIGPSDKAFIVSDSR